jgi:hypothetical protein
VRHCQVTLGGSITYTRNGSFGSDVSVILNETLPPFFVGAEAIVFELRLGKGTHKAKARFY